MRFFQPLKIVMKAVTKRSHTDRVKRQSGEAMQAFLRRKVTLLLAAAAMWRKRLACMCFDNKITPNNIAPDQSISCPVRVGQFAP
jgi:hypothetical protein